jgi:hypothetical protein
MHTSKQSWGWSRSCDETAILEKRYPIELAFIQMQRQYLVMISGENKFDYMYLLSKLSAKKYLQTSGILEHQHHSLLSSSHQHFQGSIVQYHLKQMILRRYFKKVSSCLCLCSPHFISIRRHHTSHTITRSRKRNITQ